MTGPRRVRLTFTGYLRLNIHTMKVNDILTELIANRPRTMNYWVMRSKELKGIQDAVAQAGQLLDGIDTPDDLEYTLDHSGFQMHPEDIKSLIRNITGDYASLSLGGLIGAINSYIQFGDSSGNDFYQYIPSMLEHLKDSLTRWSDAIAQLPTYQDVLNIINNPDNGLMDPQYREPAEIAATQQYAQAMALLLPAIHKIPAVVNNMDAKVQARTSFKQMSMDNAFNGKPMRPQHQNVETLYHATAYANEITQSGFAAEKPIDHKGVGNLGEQATISFTHDIKIAQDIMRSLKEFALIANGQLKARTIADWIRRENIPQFPWQEFMNVYRGSNQYGYAQYDPTTLDRLDTEKTAELFNKYIALSKIHPNPVFISVKELARGLAGRPQSDIGILACQVQLDPQTSSYHPGESEFRVQPNAVLSVKRIV